LFGCFFLNFNLILLFELIYDIKRLDSKAMLFWTCFYLLVYKL
jgi:hypothetical protein